ncbi:MAG TPA: hypothetical protein VFE32_21930 [Puia sp.]|jgi:hypothetical protein|nr:hypothetical protein [Puia sp.]
MAHQRSFRLNIRLSQKEWEKVHRLCANSTCRSVSEYARKLLTNQPITQIFRNPSLEHVNANVQPLLEYITGGASIAASDPGFLDAYGHAVEVAEDIRTYLAKLSDQCDPK